MAGEAVHQALTGSGFFGGSEDPRLLCFSIFFFYNVLKPPKTSRNRRFCMQGRRLRIDKIVTRLSFRAYRNLRCIVRAISYLPCRGKLEPEASSLVRTTQFCM